MHEPIEVFVKFNIPNEYFLTQNYPNPFSAGETASGGKPSTKINYGFPEKNHVTLQIFNLQGQLVKELVNQPLEAGSYDVLWDGRSEFGQLLPAGMYFYKLTVGNFQDIKKLVLAK